MVREERERKGPRRGKRGGRKFSREDREDRPVILGDYSRTKRKAGAKDVVLSEAEATREASTNTRKDAMTVT